MSFESYTIWTLTQLGGRQKEGSRERSVICILCEKNPREKQKGKRKERKRKGEKEGKREKERGGEAGSQERQKEELQPIKKREEASHLPP